MAVQTNPRSFPAGDLVLSCEPWIWALRWHHYGKVCAYCLTEGNGLHKCSGCKLHHYCNRTCQRADWTKEHKQECAMLKDIAVEIAAGDHLTEDQTSNCFVHQDVLADGVAEILLLKLANKIKVDAVAELPGFGKLSYREVLNLFPKNPLYKDNEKTLYDLSWKPIVSARTSGIDQMTLADCIEAIEYNTFPITDPDAKWRILGAGLFPQAPHHAMTPVCWDSNVNMGFVGRVLVIHAIRDIPSFRGLGDLRYREFVQNHLVTTREERHRSFEVVYGRSCDCLGCTKKYMEMFGIRIPNQPRMPLPISTAASSSPLEKNIDIHLLPGEEVAQAGTSSLQKISQRPMMSNVSEGIEILKVPEQPSMPPPISSPASSSLNKKHGNIRIVTDEEVMQSGPGLLQEVSGQAMMTPISSLASSPSLHPEIHTVTDQAVIHSATSSAERVGEFQIPKAPRKRYQRKPRAKLEEYSPGPPCAGTQNGKVASSSSGTRKSVNVISTKGQGQQWMTNAIQPTIVKNMYQECDEEHRPPPKRLCTDKPTCPDQSRTIHVNSVEELLAPLLDAGIIETLVIDLKMRDGERIVLNGVF